MDDGVCPYTEAQGATKKEFKKQFIQICSGRKAMRRDVCENVGFYDCHATSFYDYYSNISCCRA